MRYLTPLLMGLMGFSACQEPEPVMLDWEAEALLAPEAPPPPSIHEYALVAEPFYVGHEAHVTVTGSFVAGDLLRLRGSRAGHAPTPTTGGCIFDFCHGLLPPTIELSTESAAADGEHTFVVGLPGDLSFLGTDVALQVIHMRPGLGGWDMVVSDTLMATFECAPDDDRCSEGCADTPPGHEPVLIDPDCDARMAYEVVLDWNWGENPEHENRHNVMMTPAVAPLNDTDGDGDVDEDDVPVVVFTAYTSSYGDDLAALVAIEGDSGAHLWSTIDLDATSCGGVAIGDHDGDGQPTIFVSTLGGVAQVTPDGSLIWEAPVEMGRCSMPSLADIDGDGIAEVIVGASVVNADGSIRWVGDACRGLRYDDTSKGFGSYAVDLDQITDPADPDYGQLEIIAGCTVYDNDGTARWTHPGFDGFAATANFDDDPALEVVLTKGTVTLLDDDGSVLWEQPVGGSALSTVADFDGDGEPEVASLETGYLFAMIETDGSVAWETDIYDVSSARIGGSAFDFDGDGAAELLLADQHDLMIVDGRTGERLMTYIDHGNNTLYEYPIAVDVDNDGVTEIVAGGTGFYSGHNGVYAVEPAPGVSWARTGTVWNQMAYSITNVDDDGGIPAVADSQADSFRSAEVLEPPALGQPDLATGMPHSCLDGCSDDSDDPMVWIPIYNFGAADAPASVVHVYDLWSGGLLHVLDAPGVAAGEMAWVGPILQDTELRVVVDPDAVLEDCDDTNNAWQGLGLYCACESRGAPPGVPVDPACAEADLILIVDDWDYGDACCTGEFVEVGEWFFYSYSQRYKVDAVANQGSVASEPAHVRVTDSLGSVLLEVDVPALAPGEAYRLPGVTYDNLIYRPELAISGIWPTVEYVIDTEDAVVECDEANTYIYDAAYADECLT